MVYIDVVILINFMFDFALLGIVDLLLKRQTKISRLLLGAVVGETSLIILFYKSILLFLFVFDHVILLIL